MIPDERRFIYEGAEVRTKKGAKPGIEGYAAIFDKRSVNLGGFAEIVRPGAFSRFLKNAPDVRGLYNHNPDNLLGRTSNQTMRMSEDSKGLAYDIDLADTSCARDVYNLVDRGDVSGCSFSFTIPDRQNGQRWEDSKDEQGNYMLLRELRDVDVYDVGPVTFPAYPDTNVDARSIVSSLWPAGIPADVRSHLAADFLERLEFRGETKKVAGVDLPSHCFAYVGDENDTSTWKLPILFPGDDEKTKSHIRNALARWGQTKGIPAGEKDKVYKKIVAAAKKHGIKVSEENSAHARETGVSDAVITAAKRMESCDCECDQCTAGNCDECNAER